MLEKFIGDRLEIIGKESFMGSFFLKEINLKNVRRIGYAAFKGTSLKIIKNNFTQKYINYQFSFLTSEV